MKICALSVAVPHNTFDNEELADKYGEKQAKRISTITGIKERHVATNSVKALELMLAASKKAIEFCNSNNDFDAVIVVSQTTEYKFPATACILQSKLGIKKNAMAYDIDLGCSGFVYGLITVRALIKSGEFKRILLVAGELTNSTASPEESGTYALFGDAFSATILEDDQEGTEDQIIAVDYGTDGSGADKLIRYVGGTRYPNLDSYYKDTLEKDRVPHPDYVYMDGSEIFEFSVTVVPQMIENLLNVSGRKMNDIDSFYFHQANDFIIKHLSNKLMIDASRVPTSIELYGNTSSASIPVTICHHLGEESDEKMKTVMMLGFGVGFSWAGVIANIEPRVILPIIECE